MSFVSLVFFLFLVVVILVHYLLPHRFRYLFLLAASYLFYGFVNPWLLFLIAGVTLVAYLFPLGMKRFEKARKAFLWMAIILILGCLFVFKYLDFTIQSVIKISNLLGSSWRADPLSIILPVGISFYVFQALSYVIDVYRGRTEPERNIGYFALFISFFPQLVAGPIERFDRLMPQLKAERKFDADNLAEGAKYMVSGYLKKVVIADLLALFINPVYNDLPSHSGGAILVATVLFAFQVYGDFSGYSDIAKGTAKMLGIDLMENFDSPYLASSPRDFWRRWHISLSRFFGDYVYIPLGGSKKGKLREVRNLLIVFLLSGLWHGADAKYIVWGALHALYAIVEALLPRRKQKSLSWRIIGGILTFLLVDFAWIFFRANSLSDAFIAIARIFTAWGEGVRMGALLSGLSCAQVLLGILGIASCRYIPKIQCKTDLNSENAFAALSLLFAVMAIALAWVSVYQGGDGSQFLYFQF